MNMMSDVGAERVAMAVASELSQELKEIKDNPEAVCVLKKLGRFTLEQLWSSPDWIKEYDVLFQD